MVSSIEQILIHTQLVVCSHFYNFKTKKYKKSAGLLGQFQAHTQKLLDKSSYSSKNVTKRTDEKLSVKK